MTRVIASLFFLVLVGVGAFGQSPPTANVAHWWVSLEFDWQAMGESRAAWLNDGRFIPDNCALAGIKVYQNLTFVTVPRWTPGVPATLNQVVQDAWGNSLLRPWPTWTDQDITKANTIKNVQSMEIDPLGRMWIIDAGFLNLFVPDEFEWHQPRLIIVNITDSQVLRTYDFPPDVVTPPIGNDLSTLTWLNDIVVDLKNGFAYMSNSNGKGGIVVYDYTNNRARQFTDPTTGAEGIESVDFCGVRTFPLGPTPLDGIALYPDTTRLYYCPLNGLSLYSLPTSVLRNFSLSNNQISEWVVYHGKKQSISDGMAFDSKGMLYYGNMHECAVNVWDPAQGTLNDTNQARLPIAPTIMNWADTFGFDEQGSFYIVSNKLSYFVNDAMDFTGASGPNFRIVTLDLGVNSYMLPSLSQP